MIIYNIDDFTPSKTLSSNPDNKFTHIVYKGSLKGSDKIWFCKEIKDPATAKLELLAQEFFRLIIPHQPETRLAWHAGTGVYYVLSEEVPGFHKLPFEQMSQFYNGIFCGLGKAMVVAILLQEIDFKNGNVGLDQFNRVIKIDGDWCFAENRRGWTSNDIESYTISPETIEYLPYATNYSYTNWLDLTPGNSSSQIINPHLIYSDCFRAEVNQAILQICLVPNFFIENLVDTYMPVAGQRFIDLIKNRRDELASSALKNNSFKTYLNTSAAIFASDLIFQQMKSFKVGDKTIITFEKQFKLQKDFGLLFSKYLPIVLECENLIKDLNNFFNPEIFYSFSRLFEKEILKPAQVLKTRKTLIDAIDNAKLKEKPIKKSHYNFWRPADEKLQGLIKDKSPEVNEELDKLVELGFKEHELVERFFCL
ncbi:MAG: hypothetical protein H0U57_08775 [Tatlockia sp.]|nr:hypothetical protein [Tatlockia sp.]